MRVETGGLNSCLGTTGRTPKSSKKIGTYVHHHRGRESSLLSYGDDFRKSRAFIWLFDDAEIISTHVVSSLHTRTAKIMSSPCLYMANEEISLVLPSWGAPAPHPQLRHLCPGICSAGSFVSATVFSQQQRGSLGLLGVTGRGRPRRSHREKGKDPRAGWRAKSRRSGRAGGRIPRGCCGIQVRGVMRKPVVFTTCRLLRCRIPLGR